MAMSVTTNGRRMQARRQQREGERRPVRTECFALRLRCRFGRGITSQQIDRANQFLVADGLDEMRIEAGLARADAILGLAPAGERDDHGVASASELSYAPGSFVAIDPW